MPSDTENQQQHNGNFTDRIAALVLSRLLNVLLALMILCNSIIVFVQSVPTQNPSMVVALLWLTGAWFLLAVTLVVMASIYVVTFDSSSSVPFARIVIMICFSCTGKYLHNGGAPPLPEWPSWIDLGLILGWAVNQLCGSGGRPPTPHRRRHESPIAQQWIRLTDLVSIEGS